MPFDPNSAEGYFPSLEEILEDVGIDSPEEFREAILQKGRNLYKNSEVRKINDEEFIICDSSKFYKTFVNMGYGSAAMTILDDFSSEKYFLIFKDKIPEEFYEIAAAHEITEYRNVRNGVDQSTAHMRGTNHEINLAKHLGKEKEYFAFLKENYPMKLGEIKSL